MKRSIEIADLARIQYIGDPQITPDGTRVAYVQTSVDLEQNEYRSAIYLATTDGSWTRKLTAGTAKDTTPRWSPDGTRLAFISNRDGSNQLYVMPVDGGEPEPLSDLEHGVAEPAWSPDGNQILVTSKVGPEGMRLRSEITDEERQRESEQSDVRVIQSLKFRLDGEGFLGDERRHLVIIPLDGGRPRQITDGDWHDGQPAWSPDGRLIAFTSNRTDDREFNTCSDIWVLPVSIGDPRKLTASDGTYGAPSFSPDGRQVAFTGHPHSERYGPNTIDDLWLVNVDGGAARNMTASLDREVGNSCISDAHYMPVTQRPAWTPDGQAIAVQISDHGSVSVIRVGLDGKHQVVIGGQRVVLNFTAADNDTLAFVAADSTHPLDVFVSPVNGSSERQISFANEAFLNDVQVSEPERFTFNPEAGIKIDGWLLKPPGFRPNARYPLILQIHGGPHAMYGNTFFHELQLMAARGYIVLYTNPRGSTGAGQEFVAAAMGDWGGVDYRDLMAAVDHVISRDYVDESRLGVAGGSYGGYMTNWILTQTDRFKAGVTMRSTCNRYNVFGTSDLVWSYGPPEFGGVPWERLDFYLDRSPISHVQNLTAPLLILHSENDLRCPVEQAEQLFVALKMLRRKVELVRFPNESHNLSRAGRPDHRIERLERVLGWFDRFL